MTPAPDRRTNRSGMRIRSKSKTWSFFSIGMGSLRCGSFLAERAYRKNLSLRGSKRILRIKPIKLYIDLPIKRDDEGNDSSKSSSSSSQPHPICQSFFNFSRCSRPKRLQFGLPQYNFAMSDDSLPLVSTTPPPPYSSKLFGCSSRKRLSWNPFSRKQNSSPKLVNPRGRAAEMLDEEDRAWA
ncbi:hypothetical protein DFH06DRAFT_1187063 [Mycena polygramma]|nr:hypothetical protein DFH06DRAFT_1187063 [Mycena polygramma]